MAGLPWGERSAPTWAGSRVALTASASRAGQPSVWRARCSTAGAGRPTPSRRVNCAVSRSSMARSAVPISSSIESWARQRETGRSTGSRLASATWEPRGR